MLVELLYKSSSLYIYTTGQCKVELHDTHGIHGTRGAKS